MEIIINFIIKFYVVYPELLIFYFFLTGFILWLNKCLYTKNKSYNIIILFSSIIFVLFCVVGYPLLAISLKKTLFYSFCVILSFDCLMYYFTYTLRDLPKSVVSFFFFSLNLLILLSFIFSIFTIVYGISNPIYIENLSKITYYKYCIYTFAAIFFMFLFIVRKTFKFSLQKTSFFTKITFPYLKEEIRIILYTWNETVFGPILTKLFDSMYGSVLIQNLILVLHFCICYIFRIFQLIFFLSFVFFHGDLRLVFYTLPFLFVSWLFDFLFYYVEVYIQNSFNYINKVLIVTPKTPLSESEMVSSYIIKNGNDFKFKLTAFGYAEGFYEGPNNSGLNSLANSWLQFQHLNIILKNYKNRLYVLTIFILILRIICWLSISVYPFYNYPEIYFGGLSFLTRVGAKITPNFRTRAPSEAYTVRRQFQAALEKESGGAYKAGHPVVVDKDVKNDVGHVLAEHQPTHGLGTTDNPSYEIHPSSDLQGSPVSQRTVPFQPNTYVDPNYLGSSIPGSRAYLGETKVRELVAKNFAKDPGDLNT